MCKKSSVGGVEGKVGECAPSKMRVGRCKIKIHHGPDPYPLLIFRVDVLAKPVVRLLFDLPCFISDSMIFPIPLVGQTFPYLAELNLSVVWGKMCVK